MKLLSASFLKPNTFHMFKNVKHNILELIYFKFCNGCEGVDCYFKLLLSIQKT